MEYKLGLLGQGIGYSLSPRIFRWAFDKTGVRGSYAIIDLTEAQAIAFLRDDSKRFHGFNVTVPHKTLAAERCDSLSDTAQRARAVNTVLAGGGILTGHNTDVPGFQFALKLLLGGIRTVSNALIIGSGGAARAVIVGLSELTKSRITVAARDIESAGRRLANTTFNVDQILKIADVPERMKEYELIIQATPLGSMKSPDNVMVGPSHFSYKSCVMDLVYAPRETEFLRLARLSGARTMNGLPMLIGQAASAFELWTKTPFPTEFAMSELLPELECT